MGDGWRACGGAAGETSALARLKTFLGWRGDAEEAAWHTETGWNLFTLAAAMDDEAALDEIGKGTPTISDAARLAETRRRLREPLGDDYFNFD